MIRHSSSFFISIIVHVILLILVLVTYKTYYSSKKEPCETRVCVELRALEAKKELIKPSPVQKKIEKKVKKKIDKKVDKKKKIEKVKKKPKEKPKVKKKEIIQELSAAIVQKTPEQKIPEQKEIVEEEIVEAQTQTQEVKELKEVISTPVEKSPQELENERKVRQENISKEYIVLNTQEILRLLRENLYYPRSARKRGITGKVIVKFTLQKSASVSNIIVLESKSDILSRAAIKTLSNLSEKFPKPKESITIHIPISYSLK